MTVTLEELNSRFKELINSADLEALVGAKIQEWMDKNPVVTKVTVYTRTQYNDEGYSGFFQCDYYEDAIETLQDGASVDQLSNLADTLVKHLEPYGHMVTALSCGDMDFTAFYLEYENKNYENHL